MTKILVRAILLWLCFALCVSSSRLQAQTRPARAATAAKTPKDVWWKHAVIYELYPRSFQDSNGDGVGDLNGITQRMGYLQKLGVDAIWIAPMYPSPQVDFGYDISDYESVDPQYGTLADFDKLQAAAKAHGVRIILDMVLNHTSDKHRYFIESAASRTNPRADWYVWNDGLPATTAGLSQTQLKNVHDGRVPPNNWVSLFGGTAWEWSPTRKQFYYHKFYKQQPDLNWRSPAVEKAMFDAMRFWLDRGVAGFRLDAVPTLFEDPQLRSEKETGGTNAQGDPNLNDEYTNMLPEVHDVQRRMRSMVDKYPGDRVLIGETYLPNTAELTKWYGSAEKPELQLPMDMLVGFHTEGGGPNSPNVALNLQHFRKFLTEMETELGIGWPLLVFDNHDNTRSWDRFTTPAMSAGDKLRVAKIVATMLYTTRATPLTYYGAELGMTTETPVRVEDVRDPIGITGWPNEKGRDGERTPMQWTPGAQAGFSAVSATWLPIPANHQSINVQTEQADPASLLRWTERLIALRRTVPALREGNIKFLNESSNSVLSYVRTSPGDLKAVVVAMNMTGEPQTVSLDLQRVGIGRARGTTLASSESGLAGEQRLTELVLPPYATWVGTVQ